MRRSRSSLEEGKAQHKALEVKGNNALEWRDRQKWIDGSGKIKDNPPTMNPSRKEKKMMRRERFATTTFSFWN